MPTSLVCIGLAVLFTYLWHLLFFGGWMAIGGYAEEGNRHSLLCVKVSPKELSSKIFGE